jgi:hypothetical protein
MSSRPQLEVVASHPPAAPADGGVREPARGSTARAICAAACAIVAAAASASWLWNGFYFYSTWAPIALGALALLVALLLLVPVQLSPPGAVAVLAMGALLAWMAASALWAPSVDRAWTEADRVGLYAALLLLGVAAGRTRLAGRLAMGAAAAGAVAMAAYLTVRMLAGSGAGLFFDFRLNEPLGYTNGQAALLLVGLWTVAAHGESARSWLARASAAAGATLLLELLVLTQSRAVVPAVVVSAAVSMALPGRLRRAWLLVVVAAATAAALPALLDVYAQRTETRSAFPSDDVTRTAALAAVAAAALAGTVWAALTSAAAGRLPFGRRAAAAGLVLVALCAGGVTVAAVGNPADEVSDQWERFTSLEVDTSSRLRFTDVTGHRYDFWRIALRQFRDHPVKGVGAGNFPSTYFRERRVPEFVRQPHSIELQLLGELGLVGGLAFATFAGAVLYAALSRRRWGGPAAHAHHVRVAALGVFVVWLVHTSVDWLWNLPGMTALALLAAGLLLSRPLPEDGPGPRLTRSDPRRALATLLVLVAVAGVAASLGRHYGATRYRERATDELAQDPRAARDDARHALELNRHDMEAYYVLAAAEARFDRYDRARRVLLAATGEERFNYVPWVLLGDLATRRGDIRTARQDYERAKELNPYDPLIEPGK